MTNEPGDQFLQAVEDVEYDLKSLSFHKSSVFIQAGASYYIQFTRDSTVIELMYGPPEFHVSFLIYESGRKYEPKDLLAIPAVLNWLLQNKCEWTEASRTRDEVFWTIKLVKFCLTII